MKVYSYNAMGVKSMIRWEIHRQMQWYSWSMFHHRPQESSRSDETDSSFAKERDSSTQPFILLCNMSTYCKGGTLLACGSFQMNQIYFKYYNLSCNLAKHIRLSEEGLELGKIARWREKNSFCVSMKTWVWIFSIYVKSWLSIHPGIRK